MGKEKNIEPDEYYDAGPIDIARFGKVLIYKSKLDEEGLKKFKENLIKSYPEIIAEVNELVQDIKELVIKFDSLQLLKRGYLENAYQSEGKISESAHNEVDVISRRMIDYIQNVIVSAELSEKNHVELKEEDWNEIYGKVLKLYRRLGTYFLASSAKREANDEAFNKKKDLFYTKAQSYWIHVRGEYYLTHQEEIFKNLLKPHSQKFKELFGISSDEYIDNLCLIRDSLIFGIGKSIQFMENVREKSLKILEEDSKNLTDLSSDEIISKLNQIATQQGWIEDIEKSNQKIFGFSVFDVEKNSSLPKELLDSFSWENGECNYFYDHDEFGGWPINFQPIFEKPFLKKDDKYYCFDVYALFDNNYRTIQKVICNLDPDYREDWNKKQKIVSEEYPLKLIKDILPEAEIYSPAYYYFSHEEEGKKKVAETDAVIIYDKHLFVVEIKAGAFTYMPPSVDFDSFINSIENLLFRPLEQADRFFRSLKEKDELILFDSNSSKKKELTRISSDDFRIITPTAITIDHLTDLAVKIEELTPFSNKLPTNPVWPLSISDLIAYRDLFDSPLQFLHYIEQRHKAFKSEAFSVEDELDHVGLYLDHNHYVEYAESFGQKINHFEGYRKKIDEYFDGTFYGLDGFDKPAQKIPDIYFRIFKILRNKRPKSFSHVSSILLDFSTEVKFKIEESIEYLIENKINENKSDPFTILGDYGLTLFCFREDEYCNKKNCQEHALATQIQSYDILRLLLIITINKKGDISDIDFSIFDRKDLTRSKIDQLSEKAQKIADRRFIKMAKEIKPGRNDYCPCGSGKKYKKCHLRRYNQ
ncbi:YecA family protein [Rhodohalobacter sulfatireducens]|uniref:SEC-C domain-containing protein n=1 Tax=Rhodohalobacter sulfatireducens TaxID=2911366 RepID=A0ABS9KE34_9BACT|nr:SEC-C metal-binding domain-containing protein [Rhodohalobacter sulfatireducens]MCG2589119.1 SEC-C domain-containing protein [Rhodohalobacter sulfatireducens]